MYTGFMLWRMLLISSISGLFMNELFISLKKEIFDRLDDSLDI